ncbi:MAG: hypothetical protein R2709_08760 [Marmoricola sp.]
MLLHDPPLTRRTTLLGAAAIGAASLLAACASGSPVGDNEPAELSVDEQAAVKARDAVAQTLAAVSATSTARPGLAVLLNPIAAMHDAHLSILDQGESGAASPDVPVVPPAGRGRWLRCTPPRPNSRRCWPGWPLSRTLGSGHACWPACRRRSISVCLTWHPPKGANRERPEGAWHPGHAGGPGR